MKKEEKKPSEWNITNIDIRLQHKTRRDQVREIVIYPESNNVMVGNASSSLEVPLDVMRDALGLLP